MSEHLLGVASYPSPRRRAKQTAAAVADLGMKLVMALQHMRQRRAMATLSDHLLKDVGLRRADLDGDAVSLVRRR